MLLAGLERKPVGGAAISVIGDTHEAAWQVAFQALGHGHEGGVRAAEEQWDTETLGATDRDVSTLFARGAQVGEREQVGCDRDFRAAFLCFRDDLGVVDDRARIAWLLQHDARNRALRKAFGGEVTHLKRDPERFSAAAHHVEGLREHVRIHHRDRVVFRAGCAAHQEDRLCHGRGLIK